MRVSQLSWRSYRNLQDASITPHSGLNLFVGSNGQGKTNLLSAIYWLATLRPLRAQRLRELIRWGAQECAVSGLIERDDLSHQLRVSTNGRQRLAFREGKRVAPSDYFGPLSLIAFTPRDLSLVYGAPEQRRRFLDRAIFTTQLAHLKVVLEFQRALSSRNQLIRSHAEDTLFDAYEAILAARGATLALSRARYRDLLAPRFQEIYREITGESAKLLYRPAFPWPGELKGEQLVMPEAREQLQGTLLECWREGRSRDRQRGFTLRGPQQDELTVLLGDRPARTYASQGQQRALALALKLAEIGLLEERSGERPVLLLDDISSELDEDRSAALFRFLDQFQGQRFLTTTDERYIPLSGARRCWRVRAGELSGELGEGDGEISD